MAKPLPTLVPSVWTGGLIPAALLALDWRSGRLGANPVNAALNQLGLLALIALLATLACTPLQRVTGWTWPPRIRRALGLLAFTYASLHLLTYVAIDQGFAFRTLFDDVAKRPFVTIGFSAWLLMVPLALTSTDGAVRRLKYPRWKRLHRLAYVCAGLGVVHFVWRQKKDITEPLVYGAVLALLLLARAVNAASRKRRTA